MSGASGYDVAVVKTVMWNKICVLWASAAGRAYH
jgi:hypothetical protein